MSVMNLIELDTVGIYVKQIIILFADKYENNEIYFIIRNNVVFRHALFNHFEFLKSQHGP